MAGRSLIGEEGDLVCTQPFPCMPVFFWNDVDGTKYYRSYFSVHKRTRRRSHGRGRTGRATDADACARCGRAVATDIWYHGDFVVINPETGGLIMLGRRCAAAWHAATRRGAAR